MVCAELGVAGGPRDMIRSGVCEHRERQVRERDDSDGRDGDDQWR